MEPELRRGAVVVPESSSLTDEELWADDGGDDHSGWFCVRTDPFPCPAPGCAFVADFMTAAHLVLVWEERDDPNLLWHAQRAKEVGRNPRIVAYEAANGPSASYYAWEAAGRPVHAVKGKALPPKA
jgi:hypothetical protein